MVTEKMDESLGIGYRSHGYHGQNMALETDHMNFMDKMEKSVVSAKTGQTIDKDMMKLRQDSEPDYEPFDTEKERYIDEELLEKFHNHMEVTTHLRKTCPSKIKTKLKKIYRHEWKHITRSQVHSANSKPVEESCIQLEKLFDDSSDSINQKAIEERLGACSQKVEDINKYVRDILSKTKELVKSEEMLKQLQDSHSYRLIYETPPNTPEKTYTDTQCFSKLSLNMCINKNLNI